VLIKFPRPHLQ